MFSYGLVEVCTFKCSPERHRLTLLNLFWTHYDSKIDAAADGADFLNEIYFPKFTLVSFKFPIVFALKHRSVPSGFQRRPPPLASLLPPATIIMVVLSLSVFLRHWDVLTPLIRLRNDCEHRWDLITLCLVIVILTALLLSAAVLEILGLFLCLGLYTVQRAANTPWFIDIIPAEL